MTEPIICTIFTKDKLAHVRTLTQSFLTQYPSGKVVALLVDEIDGYFNPTIEPFEIIAVDSLIIPSFPALTMRYEQRELCAAVKPYFLSYLLQERDYDCVCYFDPTCVIYSPLDEIFNLLKTKAVVLTPYIIDSTPEDSFQPDQRVILREGVFNLGFVGVSNQSNCNEFLNWWKSQTKENCYFVSENESRLDQRWLDLAPALFACVYIYRDPGCGVSYWNLGQRQIKILEGVYQINNSPLVFFQYDGLNIDNMQGISCYQNRYTLNDFPLLSQMFEKYRNDLLANDYLKISKWPYAYDFFDNGIYIPKVVRQMCLALPGFGKNWPVPRLTSQENSFLNWLNQSEHEFRCLDYYNADNKKKDFTSIPLITNLVLTLYQLNPAWRKKYPDPLGRDRRSFVRWFVTETAERLSLDSFFVESMRLSLLKNRFNVAYIICANMQRCFADWLIKQYRHQFWFYRIFINIYPQLCKLELNVFLEKIVEKRLKQNIIPYKKETIDCSFVQQAEYGVNISGPLKNQCGMGCHVREIIACLQQAKVPLVRLPRPDDLGMSENSSLVEGLPVGNPYAINLDYMTIEALSINQIIDNQLLSNRYNIGFVWWEFDKIPQGWISKLSIYDELWVGSQYVRDILTPIVSQSIKLMPLVISDLGPATHSRKELNLPTDKHIFLFMIGAGEKFSYWRKNPLAVIRAYREAFAPNFADTLLVIKTNGLENDPELTSKIEEELAVVSGLLINYNMTKDELNSLFHACNAYVSLHRGEGFGMTMAEAMLCGKPVIATGYSGNMDFMTIDNSYPVLYKKNELQENIGPFLKGLPFAEPDINEAAKYMRRIVENPEEAQHKGRLAKQTIQKLYNTERVTKVMVKRLKEINSHLRIK